MVDEEVVADPVELVGGDAGATCLPTSSRACAAIRPATRMRSIVSGVLMSDSSILGRFLPTYSGRSIWAGTFRMGEIRPGWSSVVMKHESTGQNR